jgi:hypothetical protein
MSYASYKTQQITISCAHPIAAFITKEFIEGTTIEKLSQSRN